MPQLAPSVSSLAAGPETRACLEWFRRERQWIHEKHLEVCRVAAPTFFEEARARWMAGQLTALGWKAEIDRAGNVLASWPPAQFKPAVAVTAHLDTVLAPRTPKEIRVLGEGRLAGPGVADNGAGLAALLALAAAWSQTLPLLEAAPLLVANVGEEGEGNLSGMRYLCRDDAQGIRSFVVLDGPGADHVTSRGLASRRLEVTIRGPGGHSWRDSGHGNPVHALSRAVTLFSGDALLLGLGPGNRPRSSYNFGIFEGGFSINSIPTEARAKVDLRSEEDDQIAQMATLLTAAVERAVESENARVTSATARLSAKLKEIGSRPSGELAADAPILEAVRAVDGYLGIRSRLDCSSTDANLPLSLGLDAVSIGAGGLGGGAHTRDEWFSAEGRELGLSRALLLILMLLPQQESA